VLDNSISALVDLTAKLGSMAEAKGTVGNTTSIIKASQDDISISELARWEKVAKVFRRTFNVKTELPKAESSKAESPKAESPKAESRSPKTESSKLTSAISKLPFIQKVIPQPKTESSKLTSTITKNIPVPLIGLVKSSLTSNESSRYDKIATIFGQNLQIGKYAPRAETSRLSDLTPDKLSQTKDKLGLFKQYTQGKTMSTDSPAGLLAGALPAVWAAIKRRAVDAIKGVAKSAWKAIKGVAKSAWKAIKGVAKSAWKAIKSGSKSAWKAIKSGSESAWKAIKSSSVGKAVGKALSSAKSAIKNSSVGKAAVKALSSAKSATKNFITPAVKALSSAKSAIGNFIKPAVNVVKAAIKPGALKNLAGGAISKLFKGSAKNLSKFIKGVPIVAPLIETLFAANDINNYKSEFSRKEITKDELHTKAGKRAVEGLTSLGGAALGGVIGTALGGPVGSVIGAVGGDWLGRWLGEYIIDNLVSPDITKKIGGIVLKGSWDSGTELQDYIVQRGNITPFSSKDEVLGMKPGGAIANLFKSISDSLPTMSSNKPDTVTSDVNNSINSLAKETTNHNKFTKSALIEQLKKQDKLIELLYILTTKSSGTTVTQNNNKTANSFQSNFRETFNSHTHATA